MVLIEHDYIERTKIIKANGINSNALDFRLTEVLGKVFTANNKEEIVVLINNGVINQTG